MFTKPLAAPTFEALRDAIMNVPYGRAAAIRQRRADPKRLKHGTAALANGGVLRSEHLSEHLIAPQGCHWVTGPTVLA